jgi:hypothetical protein
LGTAADPCDEAADDVAFFGCHDLASLPWTQRKLAMPGGAVKAGLGAQHG